MADVNDVQAVIAAAQAAAEPDELEGGKVFALVIPERGVGALVDTEPFQPQPSRKRGEYMVQTVASFADYIDGHRSERTTIWVHPTSGAVAAVLDDNASDQATDGSTEGPRRSTGWGDHRVQLQLQHTREWNHWQKLNEQLVGQEQFATHIELGLGEIVEPDGADVLELAQDFYATSSSRFRSAKRLQNGKVNLQYDEEIDTSENAIDVPQEIKLRLAPFVGEDPVDLVARFRYQATGGTLKLGYQLVHPERIVEATLKDLFDELKGRFGQTFQGSSPARIVLSPIPAFVRNGDDV